MKLRSIYLGLLALVLASSPARAAEFQAGAAVTDVTPPTLPVLVNGSMLGRSVDTINTRVHARAIALSDGKEQVAIVVVDSCMIGRQLLDESKELAQERLGIPKDRILISATHSHSAPSSMGCLGTAADPKYVPFLREKLVEAIAAAQANLAPAQIGFAKTDAAEFTALRRWIRRPDRIEIDPFGNPTMRANMHAGRNWDDVTGESGPEDPDLALISIQTAEGKPLAVLGNFSMHYFGDKAISADYFGLFSEGLKARLTAEGTPFVGIMSHGCSGDIYRVDYKVPAEDRPKPTIQEYADGMLDKAMSALKNVDYRKDVELAMDEQRMTLNYRVPNTQLLEWSQRIVDEMGDRPAKDRTEIYAQEQLILHERQSTEIVVQALRIGDIAIATTPNETYAITGLKIKAASPVEDTMVIELANGGDGYIPPPEQHLFGGYNTWAARSAGLEVLAEPKITQTAIQLLESVAGKPRRPWSLSNGPAATEVLKAEPYAYWRLNEFAGPHATDATGQGRDAVYESTITYYLEGPRSEVYCDDDEVNRAAHLVGGRVRSVIPKIDDRYSVAMWIWNGMPNEGREVSGWLFSRDRDHGLSTFGDHLGVGGSASHTGKLMVLSGNDPSSAIAGETLLPRWEWQHVVLVRDGAQVSVYLNGEPEIQADLPATVPAGLDQFFFGGRSDNDSNWEGRLDEIAFFNRALSAEEAAALFPK